jgi:hypothetical protein
MTLRAPSVFVLAALAFAASAASGEPLTYPSRPLEPVVNVSLTGDADVTYTPPLGTPVTVSLLDGAATLGGRPRGASVADVGLPNAFMGGAHGIVVSAFEADTTFQSGATLLTDIFGQLPPIPSPVPLVGAALVIDIAELTLRLDGPLSSPLTAFGSPNEFLWAGEAPMTIEGSINMSVWIPSQDPIGLPEPVPFSVPLSPGALTGAFSGDAVSTTLDVGAEALEVDTNANAVVSINLGLLGAAGTVDVELTRLRLLLDGSFSGVNTTYGLTPAGSGAAGCGMGPELVLLLPALAWLRRRRA